MRRLAEDLYVAEQPQRFYGLEVGARMTVMRLGDDLLVHSPIDVEPAAVAGLGTLRWVVAPNRLHHLYVGPWIEAGAASYAPRGLPDKRPDLSFDHVITERSEPFGPAVLVVPTRCFALTNELVFLHRPSRTLVVTDLVYHFTSEAPALTKAVMWCACGYPGVRTSSLERLGMTRDVARREIGAILELDFDRLVMAHGEVVETGGREAFARAFDWLGVEADPGDGGARARS